MRTMDEQYEDPCIWGPSEELSKIQSDDVRNLFWEYHT